MIKFILSLFVFFAFGNNITLSQKTVKVLHTFKGEGTLGTTKIVLQLNMQSNGVLKGFYTGQNATFFLQGNRPLGDSPQTTVHITENNIEKGYFIIPYDIEDLEILIGKWYSMDGTKIQELNVKRIH